MSKFGKLLALLAALLIGAAQAPPRAMAQPAEADYSEFYEALEPHGRWIEHARYGTVWSPYAQEDDDWRPYSRGQWVYTEENGWYWQSEEEFGWAVYHYGRWRIDDEFGWIWIPGTEWGPAWVAWRQGEDTVGWAPLPPEADWDADSGLTAYSTTFYDSPRYASAWCFVPAGLIAAPYVWRHFSPPNRSVYLLGRPRHIDGFRAVDRRVFNRGVDRQFVERFSRRPVPVLPIRQVPTAREGFRSGNNGFVGTYRPRFDATPGRERTRPNIRPDNRTPEQRRAFERRPEGPSDFRRDARPSPVPRYEPPREARREPPQRFEPPQQRDFRREPPQQRFEPPREARREPPQRFEPPQQRDFRQEPRPPQPRFEPPRETRREPPPQQREFRREPPPQREVRREPPPQVQRQAPPQVQPQQRADPRQQPQKKSPQEEQQDRRRGPG